jgi:hypothetical protein
MTTTEGPTEFDRARWHLQQAVVALGKDLETPLVRDQSPGPGLPGRLTVAAGPSLHLAKLLEQAAVRAQRDAIPPARAAGITWRQIGEQLNLEGTGYAHIAEAAYDFAGETGQWHRDGAGWPIHWTCPTCEQRITDTGPFNGVENDETGHADGCQRHADDIAAEDAEWYGEDVAEDTT